MARFLADNPSRAYLPRLARLASGGSNPVGVEVGVADGRFSELALLDMLPHQWFMIEPFPNARLKARLDRNQDWYQDGIVQTEGSERCLLTVEHEDAA